MRTDEVTVTYDFLVEQDIGFGYYYDGNYDSETNKWEPVGFSGGFGYLFVALNAGETFIAEFDSALPAGYVALLVGWDNDNVIQATQQNGNIYTFKATEAGIYVLIVAEEDEEPVALSEAVIPNAVCKMNAMVYTPITGQTDAKFTGTTNGTYACKVTWAMGTADTSDDYTLTSTSVEYTARYTVSVTATAGGTATVDDFGSVNRFDGELVELTATANEGYTFVNWTKGSEVVSTEANFEYLVTENCELVANFKQNTPSTPSDPPAPSHVSVTLVYGNGLANETKRLPVDTGAPSAPAVNGKAFAGWYDDAACTQAHDFSIPFTANDTLYARYVEIPERSRVSFVADGRLVGIILYRPSQTELTVVPKVPAKEGYVGTWEVYTLNGKNMIVRAVYTEK